MKISKTIQIKNWESLGNIIDLFEKYKIEYNPEYIKIENYYEIEYFDTFPFSWINQNQKQDNTN